jgi:hypothetical protein
MKKKYLYIFFILSQSFFCQTPHIVIPSSTSVDITMPNNNHFAYYDNTVAAKNKLFLFFPGTGAVPFNYREVLKNAAKLGYHSIGLTYPNAEAVNTLCISSTDETCHSRIRNEVFDGIDRSIDVVVDVNNCIENRLIKLLQYLQLQFPNEGWSQYFVSNAIQWDKIIVSGHSQGGGHAGFISKIKNVDRVVMFAAMDWIPLLNKNADWIYWDGPTSKNRYFGFTHENDESVEFSKIQTTWINYGMDKYGSVANTSNPTYTNSTRLFTQIIPANDATKFHGCIISDAYTPIVNGIPVLKPIWDYMIDAPLPALSQDDYYTINAVSYSNYPNPFSSHINFKQLYGNEYFVLTNHLGQAVYSGNAIQEVDFSTISKGVYFLKITVEGKFLTKKLIKE